jgi:hypothetical protein
MTAVCRGRGDATSHALPIQALIEIFPVWVHLVDQSEFLCARPMFQVLLALQSVPDIVVKFVIHEAFQAVALGEAVDKTFAMLPHAP